MLQFKRGGAVGSLIAHPARGLVVGAGVDQAAQDGDEDGAFDIRVEAAAGEDGGVLAEARDGQQLRIPAIKGQVPVEKLYASRQQWWPVPESVWLVFRGRGLPHDHERIVRRGHDLGGPVRPPDLDPFAAALLAQAEMGVGGAG